MILDYLEGPKALRITRVPIIVKRGCRRVSVPEKGEDSMQPASKTEARNAGDL